MSSTSTLPDQMPIERVRRVRAARRLFVVLLTGFLVAGLFSVFGVRTRTVSASADGYDLEVTYAAAARPGLAVPLKVDVTRKGGFDDTVVVSTTSAYFDIVEENGFEPNPKSSWTAGPDIVWEFEKPHGDTLSIDVDGRVGPAVQSLWPSEAVTSVLVNDKPVVSVRYRTRVWP
ncbi:MAG: hypothetical protein QOJ09_2048 [Actinomycetota bacterium]|nr:hypothetical protein [Actinomycetota bacterium]